MRCDDAVTGPIRRAMPSRGHAWRIRWRRLDHPGHDHCRLRAIAGGWCLDGAAAFAHPRGPARLAYAVATDHRWRARWARIDGTIGPHAVRIRIHRQPRAWVVDGRPVPGAQDCVDLDLGFTPATNLIALRRLRLAIGAAAPAPAAWLDLPLTDLDVLEQRYERRSASGYWYEAPRFGYADLMMASKMGFILLYPRMWLLESKQPIMRTYEHSAL